MTGWPRLPDLRTGFPAPPALLERRAWRGASGYRPDETVTLRMQDYGGVRCAVLTPREALGTLVYFHGGGFRLGTAAQWAPFASQLASQAGCRIVLPDYRLAPECPFPAALQDGAAVLRGLEGDAPLLLGGDSAGGNLAAVLSVLHQQTAAPPLSGLMLFSPWLDLTLRAQSYADKADVDPLFSRDAARDAASFYLQGHPAEDPLVSPLFADLRALPRTLIVVGTAEVLLDDSLAFAQRLAGADVDVALHVLSHMTHVAVVLDPHLEGASHAFARAVAFLRERFRAAAPGPGQPSI